MSGIKGNRCPESPGTGVRNAPEYALESFRSIVSGKRIIIPVFSDEDPLLFAGLIGRKNGGTKMEGEGLFLIN